MHCEQAFFDLQVRFAQTAARLADVPLERALLDWTNLYVCFGASRAFDPRHPLWGAYVDGLRDAADPVEWTWRYLRRCPVHLGAPPVVATRGCFSYACVGDGAVRLHFSAPAQADDSPLAGSQASFRRTELRSLFAHLREQARDADPLVHGTSWLYNLGACRRLFPAAYLATGHPVTRLRALLLRGQCLDRHGRVRSDAVDEILQRIARRCDSADLDACFPFQALAVSAPASVFYAFLHDDGDVF